MLECWVPETPDCGIEKLIVYRSYPILPLRFRLAARLLLCLSAIPSFLHFSITPLLQYSIPIILMMKLLARFVAQNASKFTNKILYII